MQFEQAVVDNHNLTGLEHCLVACQCRHMGLSYPSGPCQYGIASCIWLFRYLSRISIDLFASLNRLWPYLMKLQVKASCLNHLKTCHVLCSLACPAIRFESTYYLRLVRTKSAGNFDNIHSP